ncbi:hypothetical protein TNCT_78371 [Trichonephila clavata]|uniref:Uncharacterized protein n=1 Tax=Trichonephila clavata TaxID=2740835 RepID=A0A8X6LSL3_TRICU|nr:hypothetical protein TNCT_78371 [Trichonephila clavata]
MAASFAISGSRCASNCLLKQNVIENANRRSNADNSLFRLLVQVAGEPDGLAFLPKTSRTEVYGSKKRSK